ncbi:MAG: hypothetical protein CML03_12640, partial [Pseudooceanicola sp.]|nr:hypothetical protein [Pseudooceanicola sp.]
EGKLRQTVQRAHEVGAVMSDEVITRAEELDRKFGEITSRISTLGKTIVVNLAGAIDDVLTINVDDIFGSAERAIAMMGQANYDAMKAGTDMAEDQVAAAEELFETYDALFRAIGAATGPDGIRLMDVADIDQAHDLAAILQEIDEEMAAFQNGATSAGTFEDAVSDLIGEAQDLIGELNTVDQARFGNVISAIGGIAQALATAATKATALRDELPAGGESVLHTGPTSRRGHREGSPPRSSPRPKARPATTIDMVYGSGVSSGGSSGGGGRGAAKASEYKAEADALREKTVALEAEAAALAAVALGGKKYADAVDFARKKAELLVAAQQDGREITPELSAEIDQLAEAYTRAGLEAEQAADRLAEMEERSEQAADRMTDLFAGILSGAKSGKEAVADLLLEFARMQMHKGFLSLFSSTGGGNFLTDLLGFRAQGGPVSAGMPYMVNENTPRSEVFVPSRSGGVLNVPQAQAALRQSVGQTGSETRVVVELSPELIGQVVNQAVHRANSVAVSLVTTSARAQQRQFGRSASAFDERGTS